MPCLIRSISGIDISVSKTTTSSIRPSIKFDGEPLLTAAPIAKGVVSVILILFVAVPLALRTTPVPSPSGSPDSLSSHTLNFHAFVVLLKVAPM